MRKIKHLIAKIRFKIYKRLKNGVIYIPENATNLSEAHDKVRKGGYIIIK